MYESDGDKIDAAINRMLRDIRRGCDPERTRRFMNCNRKLRTLSTPLLCRAEIFLTELSRPDDPDDLPPDRPRLVLRPKHDDARRDP